MMEDMRNRQEEALKNLSLKYKVSKSDIKEKEDICLICHEHQK